MADETEKKGFFAKLFGPKEAPKESDVGPLDVEREKKVYESKTKHRRLFPSFILFKGIMDFDAFYTMLVRWFKNRRYEFHETLYKSKPPKLDIHWEAEREKTGYVKEFIDIYFKAYEVEEVEVIKEGKKKKMLKLEVTINITPRIELAYSDIFGEKKWNLEWQRRLLDFFNKFVLRKEIDLLYDDVLWYEAYKLHADIRKYLKMEAQGHTW